MCNCNKPKPKPQPSGSGRSQEFALIRPGQTQPQRFGSRLEADAANVRNGRDGKVEPA